MFEKIELVIENDGRPPHTVSERYKRVIEKNADSTVSLRIAEGTGCSAPHCEGNDGIAIIVDSPESRIHPEHGIHPAQILLFCFDHTQPLSDRCCVGLNIGLAEQLVNRLTESIAVARRLYGTSE